MMSAHIHILSIDVLVYVLAASQESPWLHDLIRLKSMPHQFPRNVLEASQRDVPVMSKCGVPV